MGGEDDDGDRRAGADSSTPGGARASQLVGGWIWKQVRRRGRDRIRARRGEPGDASRLVPTFVWVWSRRGKAQNPINSFIVPLLK